MILSDCREGKEEGHVMNMRRALTVVISGGILALGVFVITPGLGQAAVKAGNHIGEQKQLDVDISFSREYGYTVTNDKGTYYHFWGYVFYEDKVYPEKYRGVYPLYFFGTPVGVTVRVTNLGPRKKVKVRIITESYVLRTDGSNGAALKDPEVIEIEVPRGQTREIDATFMTRWSPDMESGLDRFLVKVQHINNGGGPGNEEPALIMVKEGVFCPPEYVVEAEGTEEN